MKKVFIFNKKLLGAKAGKFAFVFSLILFSAGSFAQDNNIDFSSDPNVRKFLGIWITQEKDVIAETRLCRKSNASRKLTSLCIYTLWDDKINRPGTRSVALNCNKRFGQLDKYKDGIWSDGWAYDLRDASAFQAEAYLNKQGQLIARGFIGQKTQGKNYVFTRTDKLPLDCRTLPRDHPDIVWEKKH